MQLFVRNVSGSTMSFDLGVAPSVKGLKQAVADKTSVAPEDQRIVYAGKDLTADVAWDAYNLQSDATLDLLLRLPGGAKKKRCEAMLDATERCSQPSMTMIGECKACNKQYCSKHRLVEDHNCDNLDDVRAAARQQNSDRLNSDSVAAGSNLHNVAY